MPADLPLAPIALTILVVDDTPSNLRVLVEHLEGHGYSIAITQDGWEALERAKLIQPALILLDVSMPVMDGLETCRRLKADQATRDIPVIFMTALDDVADKVAGFDAGGVDYVTKPFQVVEVLARVNTHLALHTMRVRLAQQNMRLQREIALRQQVDAALLRAHDDLEERVARRTAELAQSREQLRALSAHMEAVREDERKRIAMEIHDELGQLLTKLKLDISLLRMRLAEDEEAIQTISDIRELVEKTILIVRDVASHLRPAALNLGIVPALEWLADDFRRHNHIPCRLDIRDGDIGLGDAQATAIFRIVQESLTNVTRHAAASKVEVGLAHTSGEFYLHIRDNGRGFDPAAVRKGSSYGLLGIGERVRLLDGSLEIDSAPGRGTTVSIRIPFASSATK